MAERAGAWYLALGVIAPAAIVGASLYWNVGVVPLVVLSFLWMGFALLLLQPPED